MLVLGLVEEHVNLIVYAVHGIEHDKVEGQQRLAPQLLRQVPVGVLLEFLRSVLVVQESELRVNDFEFGIAAVSGAKVLPSARAQSSRRARMAGVRKQVRWRP